MSGVMENAVGGLIASETHGMLALLLSRIADEIKLGWDYTKELKELQSQFTTLSLLLEGASFQTYNNNNLVHDWLNKVANAAYEADDLLDECSYDALKRRDRNRKARDKLKDGVTSSFSRYHMARRVRKLRKLIAKIYSDAKVIGLKPIKVASAHNSMSRSHGDEVENRTQQNRRQWVDDRFLVGRYEDITRLVRLLCDPRNTATDFNVVGIVGLAGLGKTALSKRVAKAQEVMECFNSHVIWLVVSHSFNQSDILKKMVESLYGEASNLSESQAIVNKLRDKLNGKRYLLVLDDVWDTFDWEPFRCALQEIGGSKGTSLLVTSRGKNVVAKMDTYSCDNHGENVIQKAYIYKLQGLNEDDSWSLFMARMSGDNQVGAGDEAYVIARRMIKKCGGVPLAIRALGDLLREQNIKAWKEIEKSDVWEKEDQYGILPSLKLSFIYLPNTALRKCFSYCAIFGEDEVIEKDKLIQLWMAQGFLQPCDKMELTGEKYLNILLNSSFFQEAELDELGNVETFKIHDLVLSLARVVSSDSKFLNLEEKIKINDTSSGLRHQSTTLFEGEITATFCKKFRTYYYNPRSFYLRVYISLKFLAHSMNLRVLCLCNLGLKELPESVGCLKHLRYLDISGNEFGILPKVITKIYHLQTLRVLSIGKVYGRKHFPILSKEVSSLVNLRHICASKYQEIGIPLGLCHLTALQTIPIIDLREDWGGRLSELGPLFNLKGTLSIQGLECIHCLDEARGLNLGSKLNVDRLILKWSRIRDQPYNMNNEIILEALQPHESLSKLEVGFYGGTRLPRWLMEMKGLGGSPLYNLVSLRLNHFTYAEGNLNVENLRSLRLLSIKQCYLLTVTFPKHGFQCCRLLEVLMLDGCNIENLPNLSPLTRLRALGITSCHGRRKYKLELAGLSSLPCLNKLYTDELLPIDLVKDSPLCESLRILDLGCRNYLYDGRETLPVQLQHLEALQTLEITEFECLETLPDWLGKLTSLERLMLVSLPKLKCLPSQDVMQSLNNLKYLHVRGCPLLEEKFRKKNGELFKVLRVLDVSWLNSERQASSSVEQSFVQGRFNVISENYMRNSI
ncbi:putative disease resistance protein RGA3 [Chenopodium quinoa]|nr:putative disease resistance protein RGA3 [Chenopodium quinoa]